MMCLFSSKIHKNPYMVIFFYLCDIDLLKKIGMKHSSKLLVCVLFAFLSFNVFAQSKWSITGGYLNASIVSTDMFWGESDFGNDNGFYLGAIDEIPIQSIQNFYFEPAFIYSFAGSKNGSILETIHIANIPLRFKYKANVSKQAALFGFFGPVFSMGISATERSGKEVYSLYDELLRRGDIKLGIGAGVELSRFLSFRVGYDWGLFNASKISGLSAKINYLHAGVSVAL